MGYILNQGEIDNLIKRLAQDYLLLGPTRKRGEGRFSDADLITYDELRSLEDLELQEKSHFSPKEILFPPSQTLFYFTEDECREAQEKVKPRIIFLRSCDFHAIQRLDNIFLTNGGFVDTYYQRLREKTHFFVLGCERAYKNCFCVSLGTNSCTGYDAFLNISSDKVHLFVNDTFKIYLEEKVEEPNLEPQFITENETEVQIPEGLHEGIFEDPFWQTYDKHCIGCGRCNFSCPTCTCFTMQDLFYRDNRRVGERRRVWASCQVDGFTEMAGGHSFRKKMGQRMRFKVMHKAYDYPKRFGKPMCVGCGRCDDICPEYISFSKCLEDLKEVIANGQ